MSDYPEQREGLRLAGEREGVWRRGEEGIVCMWPTVYEHLLACERLAEAVRGMAQPCYLTHLRPRPNTDEWQCIDLRDPWAAGWGATPDEALQNARDARATPEAALGIEEDE
jgi:hypothetical protein